MFPKDRCEQDKNLSALITEKNNSGNLGLIELSRIMLRLSACCEELASINQQLRTHWGWSPRNTETQESTTVVNGHDDAGKAPPVRQNEAGSLARLTASEVNVLKHIGEGKRTKEIAFDLGISLKTVATHRSNIMNKLNIHEAPNLVRFAIRAGLCQVE